MAVNDNKLWNLLIDKGMTKTQLRLATDMSTTTLAKLKKTKPSQWTLWMSLTRLEITIV